MTPFKDVKFLTCNFEDLVGKTLQIHSFKEDDIELIIGKNVSSGYIYVLKEIRHPIKDQGCKNK